MAQTIQLQIAHILIMHLIIVLVTELGDDVGLSRCGDFVFGLFCSS